MSSNLIIEPTPEDLDKIRGYKIGQWRTHKNYKCIYCQYSTLWLPKMQKHQAADNHPWAFPGQNPKTIGSVADDDPTY